jgi:hypothetical protein
MLATALSQAFLGNFTKKIAAKAGIDVAQISLGESRESGGNKSLRAEAVLGKYLTKRLYLGYRRVFCAADNENINEGNLVAARLDG